MTVSAFKELLVCNEPDFEYNGQMYSICCPNGVYFVTASASPGDIDLRFDSVDDMLDNWVIQGSLLRDILKDIEI